MTDNKKKRRQKQKGFTLIELMAVLAILAMLMLIAVPAVGNILAKAERDTAAINAKMIEKAAQMAHASGLPFDEILPDHVELLETEDPDIYYTTTLLDTGLLSATTEDESFDPESYVMMASTGTFSYHTFSLATVDAPVEDVIPANPVTDFSWGTEADGTVRIGKYIGTGKDVVIPNEINGKPVTVISAYAFDNMALTSVKLPNTTRAIFEYAFRNNQLTEVVFPETVTLLGRHAFANNKLTAVTIPAGVTANALGTNTFIYNQIKIVTVYSREAKLFTSSSSNQFGYNPGPITIRAYTGTPAHTYATSNPAMYIFEALSE